MRAVLWLLSLGWVAACTTVRPPVELEEARSRYQTASRSDYVHDDPNGLEEARLYLDAANKSFAQAPGSAETVNASREALTRIHRWQWMAQMRSLDQAMNKVMEADAKMPQYATGHFNRRSDAEMRVGALGSAVGGLCDLHREQQSLTMRFAPGALFLPGESELTPPARARLEQAAEAVVLHAPDARVSISPGAWANVDQARTVRDLLIESGVAVENVELVTGAHAQHHGQRVEIMVAPPADVSPKAGDEE
ncbi:MAG: hypothetical protein QM723_29535 [Myxococcaceae bacterium]